MDRTEVTGQRRWWAKVILAILVLDVLLAFIVLISNGYTWQNVSERLVGRGVKAMTQGLIGPGTASGIGNDLSMDKLMPGDIILGGKPGATYGEFTHAAIYEGEGWAWQGWLSLGVSRMRVSDFRSYDRAAILRVDAPYSERLQAVEEVSRYEGKVFYSLAFKPGMRLWNCSKIVWEPYHKLGYDLDSQQDLWITPDSIYRSPRAEVIEEAGGVW